MFDDLAKQCDIEVALCNRIDHGIRRDIPSDDVAQLGNPARLTDGLIIDIDA